MRVINFLSIVSFLFFFISCENDIPEYHHYERSYFLGETSFVFEGEISVNDTSLLAYPVPIVARLQSGTNVYENWEISGNRTSETKFQIPINITAEGLTIDKETKSENNYWQDRFPNNFPVYSLDFYFSEYLYPDGPEFIDDKNNVYHFTYVYVAEPIHLSGTETFERDIDDYFWHHITKIHYDLDFSLPGWYLIIQTYKKAPGNDPIYSSGKNNMFFFSD